MTLFSRLFRQSPSPQPGKEPVPGSKKEAAPVQDSAAPAAPDVGNDEAAAAAVTPAPVIESIDDEASACRLAVEGSTTSVRQMAAEAVTDPANIRQLVRELRGKDKNVYRILKGKADALLAQERQVEKIQADIVHLCAALERHSHWPYDAMYLPTLEHLEEQWQELVAHADAPTVQTAETYLELCREAVAREVRKQASHAAHEAAIAGADVQRQNVLQELRKGLAELYAIEGPADPELQAAMAKRLSHFAGRWEQAGQYKPADSADAAAYEALHQATDNLCGLIAQHGTVSQQAEAFREPAADAELAAQAQTLRSTLKASAHLGDSVPSAASEAAAALQAWEQSRAEENAAAAHAVRQTGSLIAKAGAALKSGATARAMGLRRAIEEKLGAAPPMPPHILRQLEQLDARLNELRDWKDYAVAPKRVELIAQMEALVGAGDDPGELARRIKALQEEWKTISKGGAGDAQEEWERFHAASQEAFKPCREYFEAQAKLRQENLEKRRALLARLEAFEAAQDWEHPDWREVARALRESRREWYSHTPTDRAAGRALQESFDALTARLQEKLDGEYAGNVKQKKSLIARAQKLLAEEDGRKAVDDVKRLQQLWKETGPVERKDDRRLWEEFRGHCDAVFGKRQQQYAEHSAQIDAQRARGAQICEEVEKLAALSGQQLQESAQQLGQLREEFVAIDTLPAAVERELRGRFEEGMERCGQGLARQRTEEEEQRWQRLLQAANLARAGELAKAAGADETVRQTLQQDAETFIASVQHWPKGGLQIIQARLAKDDAGDLAANEAALRMLCIRAEVATDTPTPEADQGLRRQYQVQRLVEVMGQGGGADAAEISAMTLEWVGAGPVSDELYTQLLERFERCRAKWREQSQAAPPQRPAKRSGRRRERSAARV